MQVSTQILELVERFERNIDTYRSGKYNETQVRREFIDPLFEELGWDITNKKGYSEAYKHVIHEDAIKVGGITKAPDYCFRIGGVRKFFLEAKKPIVNIRDDIHPAYQLRRYAWSAKLPLSILTDFEEFSVYDSRVKPNKTDKASHSRILYLKYTDYIDKWDVIANIFSREAILKGSFDKYVETKKSKKGTTEVDTAFLQEIERWRELLARNIALRNPDLSKRELNFAVQKTIDRIVFLRICEDRGIEKYGSLIALQKGEDVYQRLFQLFRKADGKYNSGLFHFRIEKGRENFDSLTPSLKIDDKFLKDIFKNLYYPDSPYEFSVLPADILGQVYERFLGKVIRLTAKHQAKIEEKPEVRKAGGVYYTPTYVVNYIVKNTVGKLVEGKKPGPRGGVSRLKILDPACGSGSFLIGAYQFLLDWHRDQYVKDRPSKWAKGKIPRVYQSHKDEWRLTTDERKRILLNNIYGVDIDHQAVEVTKLSLLLKVLEGEDEQSIGKQMALFQQRALPDLSNNIKCGNSLIGPDYYENRQMSILDEEEIYHVNAFEWGSEFPDIMKNGGFDVVIGNPPWGASLSSSEKKYLSQKCKSFSGNHDSYLFFTDMLTTLVNSEGYASFITPDTWIKVPQAEKLRRIILEKKEIKLITTLPSKIFKKVSANCIIFVLGGRNNKGECSINLMSSDADLSLLEKEEFKDRYKVKVSYWRQSDDCQFQIYQKNEMADLFSKIRSNCTQAKTYLDVMQGIVPYSRENHSEDIVKNRLFHTSEKISEEYGLWIQGRSISRYKIKFGKKKYLRYGKWLHRPRKKKYFEGPRILIQEITAGNPPRISACYCDSVLYHDPGIISCLNIGEIDILFLLGILNSSFLSWYHRYSSPKGIRKAFPKVLIGDIRKFPIPFMVLEDKKQKLYHDQIVHLVKQILNLHRQIEEAKAPPEKGMLKRQIEITDKEIDKLVYKLYNLTDDEIKIVESEN